MGKWVLLAVAFLLVVMPRCDVLWSECSLDFQCDDDNPCTTEYCDVRGSPSYDPDASFCSDSGTRGYCEYGEVEDGTPCEADGQAGVCESGECRLEGGAPDGGV